MLIDYLPCLFQEIITLITTLNSFSDYYILNVEIKDFNVLIDRKTFFDFPVKNEKEIYEKIIEMSNNENSSDNEW